MKIRRIGIPVLVFLFAATAYGQTKISGSLHCAKGDPTYSVKPTDHAGHMLVLAQLSCNWANASAIGGVVETTNTSWTSSDVRGNSAHVSGYADGSDGAGNDSYAKFSGRQTLKGGALVRESGTWTYTGGSGKLKNLQGHGTYSCKGAADGSSADCSVSGVYTIGTAAAKP